MAEAQEDKTEEATPKRLRDAREKGEVAQSRDLSSALVMGTGFFLASSALGLALVEELMATARRSWSGEWPREWRLADYHALVLGEFTALLERAAPLIGVLLVVAIAAPLVQSGPLFSTKALAFRGSKLDPIKGFKRFVAPERLVELGKSLLKLALILGFAIAALVPALDRVQLLHDVDPVAGLMILDSLAFRVWAASLTCLVILGVGDLLWVRYRHAHKLRMTRREVRDELKEQEGSPEVRARRRSAQQEASRLRMIAEVASADVVVRNPTHYAVALRYARNHMGAPEVIAKGRNRVAERILAVARKHSVPTVENPPVARLLYRTAKVGREIPEPLYQAVAEILAYVYRLDQQRRRAWGGAA